MPLRSEEVHIESERLSIRPFSADDADASFRCITPSLTRFMSWEPPANRDDFDRIWLSWLPTIVEGTDFVFAIRHRDDRNFLGLAGLHRVRTASAELGIWIREDFHQQGFGREAVGLVARWASLALGIEMLHLPGSRTKLFEPPHRRISWRCHRGAARDTEIHVRDLPDT